MYARGDFAGGGGNGGNESRRPLWKRALIGAGIGAAAIAISVGIAELIQNVDLSDEDSSGPVPALDCEHTYTVDYIAHNQPGYQLHVLVDPNLSCSQQSFNKAFAEANVVPLGRLGTMANVPIHLPHYFPQPFDRSGSR